MHSAAYACLACASLALSPGNQAGTALRVLQGTETNLLRNPKFEEQSAGRCTAWSAARNGYQAAVGEGRSNSVALACQATDDRGWSGASQNLTLNRTAPAPLIVRGWSKALQVSGGMDGGYSLYVDLRYQDGTPLWGQTGNFRVGTHDWEQREFVILPEKPVQSLTLHCIFRGHAGQVWFDDVQVSEMETPAGAMLFQGTPVAVVPTSPVSSSARTASSTSDGLKVELAGGRVSSLTVNGRELSAAVPSGFLARDVAANSDFFTFTDGTCEELNLRLETAVTAASNHLVVDGKVTDMSGRDRAILLAFALPIDAQGWTWDDDIRRSRPIQGIGEFSNVVTVNSGSTGTQSVYPLAAIHDRQSGLAMALDMGKPAQYRLAYHAGTKQLLVLYDFGLVKETARFPSSAEFRFVLYHFDPRWGFRAALQKLTEIFPDYFVVRSPEQGIWMPFTDISKVERWQDFGFRYHEGNNNVPFDDQQGILSFRYTEPMTWWMRMAADLPRDQATALRVRDQLASAGGRERRMAEVSRAVAMQDADGQPALLFRNEPWANGAVWSLNPNPLLPADPNGATVHWNLAIKEQLYGPNATGVLDGEYLDSLEGYVTAELNFRREHFRDTTVPLTFASVSHQPALAKGLAVFEFTRWISEDLHRLGKLCFANGVPYRFGFLCPWLDVMGTETDWLVEGKYQPSSHQQMALWRTLSGRKPYVLLMNTDYEKFRPEWVERYFSRSLFYGMFPSMFSHNASENPYWQNPKWYNRDRVLFQRYLPLIKRVAEAGWQPVTIAASDNAQLLVERFGPDKDGSVYYTVFNDSDRPQHGELRELSTDRKSPQVATELLSAKPLELKTTGWALELAPEAVAVVQIRAQAQP